MYYKNRVLFSFFMFSWFFGMAQFDEPIHKDLLDDELLISLINDYKPSDVLSYGAARDYMYGEVYNVNDSVECVYSGYRLFLPDDVDPSTFLSMNGSKNGINCEHTVPRSKGASEENGNPHSDMHHLFPTRAEVNNARANYPFHDIKNTETQLWFMGLSVEEEIPQHNIDLYSEKGTELFEPRESHKGNVARAMFYFYTMYREEANAADPNFFALQRARLCLWNDRDPVDELELARTYMIADMQDDKPNPFILDCTLAERLYCAESEACELVTDTDNAILHSKKPSLFPNPVVGSEWISIKSEMLDFSFSLYDLSGQLIIQKHFHNASSPIQVSMQDIYPGVYMYQISQNQILERGTIIVN